MITISKATDDKPLTPPGFLAHWLVFVEGYQFAIPHPTVWESVAPNEPVPSAEEITAVLATPYLFALPVELSLPDIVLPQVSLIDGIVLRQDGDTVHVVLFREDDPADPLKPPLRLERATEVARLVLTGLRRALAEVRRLHCDVVFCAPLAAPPILADFTFTPSAEPLRVIAWQVDIEKNQIATGGSALATPRELEMARLVRYALPRYQLAQRSGDFLRQHWWRIAFKPHGVKLAQWLWQMSQVKDPT